MRKVIVHTGKYSDWQRPESTIIERNKVWADIEYETDDIHVRKASILEDVLLEAFFKVTEENKAREPIAVEFKRNAIYDVRKKVKIIFDMYAKAEQVKVTYQEE